MSRKPTDAELAAAAEITALRVFQRQPAQLSRVRGEALLFARFIEWAQIYENGDLQSKRDAVAGQIMVLNEYLSGRGFPPVSLTPLMRVLRALVEREDNSVDPLFAERARGGRPSASMADHFRTGVLGALADEYLRVHATDGRPQKQKLADAARQMSGGWFGQVTSAQLKTARDIVMQEARDHPAVANAADIRKWLDHAATQFGDANAFAVMVRSMRDLGGRIWR